MIRTTKLLCTTAAVVLMGFGNASGTCAQR